MGLIRDPEKTYPQSWILDPGVKKAPDPGSRIQIRNTGINYQIFKRINNAVKIFQQAYFLQYYVHFRTHLTIIVNTLHFL